MRELRKLQLRSEKIFDISSLILNIPVGKKVACISFICLTKYVSTKELISP